MTASALFDTSLNTEQKKCTSVYNFVHQSTSVNKILSARTCCSFFLLKKFETELLQKGILHQGSFFPLWFHAENEINVSLWRNGFSLLDKKNLRFWIDVPRLIKSRFKKLRNSLNYSPLDNPNWYLIGDFSLINTKKDCSNSLKLNEVQDNHDEILYLEELEQVYKTALPHLYSFSLIEVLVDNNKEIEQLNDNDIANIVIIPHLH
jgi:hypothetical protein